ncbi:hypothetical protein MUK70_02935 [Dyadobacter chenwenxiniae]|uniref:Uncharacterized protein n=1 Tax=Dyadobacter chenwenxiniae TaxID=2906456 RepID=A0A9X1PLT4_9BACT|nr:hypothetical protein [Dyadobacter chenwenxiniae]MCF0062294.1 hypothetical protein [Dyadobacter chenwenxiniae]UON83950.1 hypothetical protein MUK70_02935 [Dyadobacter chenwenxiniae]
MCAILLLVALLANITLIGQCAPLDPNSASRIWYKDSNNAESTIQITGSNAGYSDSPNITINANVNTWSPKLGENDNPICENVFRTGSNHFARIIDFPAFSASKAKGKYPSKISKK